MKGTSLLSLPEGMLIDQIQITETGLVLNVIATHPASCCPLCSEVSSSLHSHYQRTLSDVPCRKGQRRGASWLDLANQQGHGRRSCDEVKTDETTNVRKS